MKYKMLAFLDLRLLVKRTLLIVVFYVLLSLSLMCQHFDDVVFILVDFF